MTKATPKHKVTRLNRKEMLAKALKAFDAGDHKYIRELHNDNPKRSATAKERKFVCDQKARDANLTQEDLVKWAALNLNLIITQPTVSRWLLNSPSNQEPMSDAAAKAKRKSSVKFPELEKKLQEWFDKYQHCVNMTGDLIRRKAEKFRNNLGISEEELNLSGGWLDSFKKRHGIDQKKRFGESGDVDMAFFESKRPEIRSILDQYSWSDIYNMDETSLFYQQEDTRSLANTRHKGRKISKKRLTLSLCCNGDGSDRLRPFIIGHSKKSHCFRNVNMSRIKCTYRNNARAWMTTFLFAEWLKAFDFRMRLLGKNEVVLILDNFSGHMSTKLVELPQLERTRILYLPENTTSKLQPLEAGIIRNFKLYYRKRFNRCILDRLEALDGARVRSAMDRATGINRATPLVEDPKQIANINVLEAMEMTIDAWNDVTQQTLHNCFRHCGIKTPGDEQEERDEQDGVGLDQGAVNDIEKTFKLLSLRRPEYFRGDLDIRALLNNEEDDSSVEEYADTHMTIAELLAADDDDEEEPSDADEEEEEEVPIIPRQEAHVCLKTILLYIQQQDEEEGDMSQEMASIKKLLDFNERKRVLTLQQTNIGHFFRRRLN